MRVQLCELGFRLAQLSVSDRGHALQVTFALCLLLFHPQPLDPLLDVTDPLDAFALLLPCGFQRVRLFADSRQLLLDHSQPLARIRIVFLLQRLALDLKIRGAALQLIDLHRHRADLHRQ